MTIASNSRGPRSALACAGVATLLACLPFTWLASGCGNGWRGDAGDDGVGGSSGVGSVSSELDGDWILVEYEYPDEGEVEAQDHTTWTFAGEGATYGSLYISDSYQGDWYLESSPTGDFTLDESFDQYLTLEQDGYLPYSYGVRRLSANALELQHDVGLESNRIDRFVRAGSSSGPSGGGDGGSGGGDASSGTGSYSCDAEVEITNLEVYAADETATGIEVSAGEAYVFIAEGSWCWGECSDADGTPGRPYSDELPVTVDGSSFGTLSGRVGSKFFEIGSCRTVIMPASGQLALLMNDRVGSYEDNSGSLSVTIFEE